MQKTREHLLEHLRGHLPGGSVDVFEWTLGPINQAVPGFRIVRISPDDNRDYWTYVSCGAASFESPTGDHLEFFILAPADNAAHVESLAMIAHFHATYRLDVGSLVQIGRPWVDESTLSSFLVSLPYLHGPKFEWAAMGSASVRLLWLFPVTESERLFGMAHGVEALEEQLEMAGVNYLDPFRKPVDQVF